MDARLLRAKYCIEHTDLPNAATTVVQIVGVEQEPFEADDGTMRERPLMFFHGWRLPLRINNTRLDTLIAILGSETDHWIGRKIMLAAMPVSKFGKTELDVVIHPLAAPDEAPVTPAPTHMIPQQSRPRLGQGRTHALPMASAGPGPAGPVGIDRAVDIAICLVARNKTVSALAEFLRARMPALSIDVNALPTWPGGVIPVVKQYLLCFPKVKEVPVGEADRLRKEWTPSPRPSAGTELIDMATGEVITPGVRGGGQISDASQLPSDDIPF